MGYGYTSRAGARGFLDIRREFIKSARVMAMFQDASGKRLTVRYSAANKALDDSKGLLRIVHDIQPGSVNIATSTKIAIKRFSTARLGASFCGAFGAAVWPKDYIATLCGHGIYFFLLYNIGRLPSPPSPPPPPTPPPHHHRSIAPLLFLSV